MAETVRQIVSSPNYFTVSSEEQARLLTQASDLPTGSDVAELVNAFATAPEFESIRPREQLADFTLGGEIPAGEQAPEPQPQQEIPQVAPEAPALEEQEDSFILRHSPTARFLNPLLFGTPEEREKALDTPLLNLAPTIEGALGEAETTAGQVTYGAIAGTAELLDEFTTPRTLGIILATTPLLAVPYLGTLILAGFSASMAIGAAQIVPEVQKALDEGDVQEAAKQATKAIETGFLAAAAAGGTVKTGKKTLRNRRNKSKAGQRDIKLAIEELEVVGDSTRAPVINEARQTGKFEPTIEELVDLAGVTGKGKPSPADTKAVNAITSEPNPNALPLTEPIGTTLFPSIEHLTMQPEGKAIIRGIIVEAGGFLEQRRMGKDGKGMSFAETEKRAKTLVADINLKPGTILNAEESFALGETLVGLEMAADAAQQKMVTWQQLNPKQDVPLSIQSRVLDSWQRLIAVTEAYAGNATETGRALAILRANKKARGLSEVDKLLKLRANLAKNGLNEKEIGRIFAKLETMPNVTDRMRYLRDQQKPGFKDFLTWYYFNNILSNPKTHERNILGTTTSIFTQYPGQWTKAATDIIRLKPDKARNVFMRELPHQAMGMIDGFRTGSQKAMFMLKEGFSLGDQEIFDIPRIEIGGGPKSRAVLNIIPRVLGAADLMMKGIVYESEIAGQAYALSRKAGLKGEAFKQSVADLKNSPTRQMTELAGRKATRVVFRDDPGGLARKVIALKEEWKTLPRPLRDIPVLDFMVPFVRTPASILRAGFEAGPGFVFLRGIKGGKLSKLKGRELDQAQGLAMFGTMMLYPSVAMAMDGRLSGDGPKDAAERSALMAQGWQRNSMLIPLPHALGEFMGGSKSAQGSTYGPGWGEYWINYILLQPLSTQMGIVANMYEGWIYNDEMPTPDRIATAAAETTGAVIDQSFMRGITNLQDYLADPTRQLNSFVSQFAQGFVPLSAATSGAARAVDPIIRDAKTIYERLQTGIPYASQDLLPRVDIFGEPLERIGTPETRGFIVPEVSPVKNDPVYARLAELDMTPSVPGAPTTLADGRETTREEQLWISQLKGRQIRLQWEKVIEEDRDDNDKDRKLRMQATQRAVSSAISSAAQRSLAFMPDSVVDEGDILEWHRIYQEESTRLMRPWFTDPKRSAGLRDIMRDNFNLALGMLRDLSQEAAEQTNRRGGFE